jgi:hypothetical protein
MLTDAQLAALLAVSPFLTIAAIWLAATAIQIIWGED